MSGWQNFVNGIQLIGSSIGGAADSIGQMTEATKGFGSQASESITDIFDALNETPVVTTENKVDIGLMTWAGIGALLIVLIYMFKRK